MFYSHAKRLQQHLNEKPLTAMRLFTLADVAKLGLPAPFDCDADEHEQAEMWREMAKELEGKGTIAFGCAKGLVVYPGRWRADAMSASTWAQHGTAEAERRVYAWLINMAVYEADTLHLAGWMVQRNTTRTMAVAAYAKELAYYKMGVDHTHGGDGQAARQEAEEAIWRGFRRRIRELAGVVDGASEAPTQQVAA